MSRNVVFMSDGTGNELKVRGNTNVVRLYSMLERNDASSQVVMYDPGVGTLGSQGALTKSGRSTTKLLGKLFGYGLKANVADGYRFIADSYEPGDHVYLFGFSRGAYTVRAVAGLINHVGLMPPNHEHLIPYAMKLFWHSMERNGKRFKPISDDEWDLARAFSRTFARPDFQRKNRNGIRYLGAWDTVNATGTLRRKAVLPYTARLEVVEKARHAVAIDEQRKPYRPSLLKYDSDDFDRRAKRELLEVWFAGVHSWVGGDHELSDIALQWIAQGGVDQGLLVDMGKFLPFTQLPRDRAFGPVGGNGWYWKPISAPRRLLPRNAIVHESALIKRSETDYAPVQVPKMPPCEPWHHEGVSTCPDPS